MLLKAIKIRTERANALTVKAHSRTQLGLMFMVGAFAPALVLTAMTFVVLRRTVITRCSAPRNALKISPKAI